MNKKTSVLQKIRRYVECTNSILVKNRLKVSSRYKYFEDIRCVEILLDGELILNNRIDLICDHTDTSLHAIGINDGKISIYLTDKKEFE